MKEAWGALMVAILSVSACMRALPPRATGMSGNGVRLGLLGCYSLRDKNGRPLDSTYYNSADIVRLDTLPEPTTPDEFKARMTGDHLAPRFRGPRYGRLVPLGERAGSVDLGLGGGLGWWQDSVTDSIQLSFVNGFSGTGLTLNAPEPLGDTLRGRIVEHWDFGPGNIDRGAGSAIRVRCP